jgi:hypothetical protein
VTKTGNGELSLWLTKPQELINCQTFSSLPYVGESKTAAHGTERQNTKKVLEYTKHEQQNSIIIHSFRTRKPARQQHFD